MANEEQGKRPQIQLQLDEQVAQGNYANLVVINHSDNEFVLDFAFLQPAAPLAKVRARVICSPRHAKRTLVALQRNIEAFEARFGKIEVSNDEPPSFVH